MNELSGFRQGDHRENCVLFVVSDIDRALAFEWIASYSRQWTDFRLAFVFLTAEMPRTGRIIAGMNFQVVHVKSKGKLHWIQNIVELGYLYKKIKPAVIHCHLLVANIIGLSARLFYRRASAVYTRHHSNLHHVYHPKGVIWDLYANYLSTRIVSISPAVTSVLTEREHVPLRKIVEIPHGFNLNDFKNVCQTRVDSFLCRHNIPKHKRLIGVISRFVVWKGVDYVIHAFMKLLARHDSLHLVLLNAVGPHNDTIARELNMLPDNSFTKIAFDEDIAAVYASFTCFVHVPIDQLSEAFGQTYVEALAAGVPSVFTLSGIATSFIEHEKHALVVPFKNSDAIERAIDRLLQDEELRERLAVAGAAVVERLFNLSVMMSRLRELYMREVARQN